MQYLLGVQRPQLRKQVPASGAFSWCLGSVRGWGRCMDTIVSPKAFFLCMMNEGRRQGTPNISLASLSHSHPSNTSEPFLRLFLLPGRFLITGKRVLSQCIYCQSGARPPPTSFQILGSQEPNLSLLYLQNKFRPTETLSVLPGALGRSPEVLPKYGWHLWTWEGGRKRKHGFSLDLGNRQRDETLPSVPPNSFL